MVFTALFGTLAAAGADTSSGPVEGLRLVAVALGTYATVRAWRYRIRLGDDRLHVRGLLWNRSVPRSAVREISPVPAVLWQAGQSRRWTPLHPFLMSSPTLPSVRRRTEQVIHDLSEWAADPRQVKQRGE